jgi:hypothetical protein
MLVQRWIGYDGTSRTKRQVGVGIVLGTLCLFGLIWESSHFDRFGFAANESSTIGSLRTLYSANGAYAKSHPRQGYPNKLSDLSMHSEKPEHREESEWVIHPALASGVQWGYRFTYTPKSLNGDGKLDRYTVTQTL